MTETESISSVVLKVINDLNMMSSGDLAVLRRGDSTLYSAPYWKVMLGSIPEELRATEQQERDWNAVLNIIANTFELHRKGVNLGAALSDSGFSELRLNQILSASGDALNPLVRRMGQYLASKATPVDLTDVARIVLFQEGELAKSVRQNIARHYFRVEFQKNK